MEHQEKIWPSLHAASPKCRRILIRMSSQLHPVAALRRLLDASAVVASACWSCRAGDCVPEATCTCPAHKDGAATTDECGIDTSPQPGVRNSSEGLGEAWRSQGCATTFTAKPLGP